MDTSNGKVSTSQTNGIIEKLKKNISRIDGDPSEEEMEDAALSFHLDTLTPKMVKDLKTRFHETEETKAKALKELRALIDKEENLYSRTEENFLLQFLRARKYDVKKAFKTLQNYYGFRKEFEDIYISNVEIVDKTRAVLLKSYFGFLRHRARNGSVVFVVKGGMWDPDSDKFEDLFRCATCCMTYAVEFPPTQVCGFSVIFDLRNITWNQVKICTPRNVILLIRSTQQCFPGRYRDIHILTESKLYHVVWAIVYPFLTSKLKKRIHFYGKDLTELQTYIHPSVLPEEFGGQFGTFDNTPWSDVLYKEEKNIINWLQYGYK